jgi:hypothetical protein
VGNVLDALSPDSGIQGRVQADIVGPHGFSCKLDDRLDGTRSALSKQSTIRDLVHAEITKTLLLTCLKPTPWTCLWRWTVYSRVTTSESVDRCCSDSHLNTAPCIHPFEQNLLTLRSFFGPLVFLGLTMSEMTSCPMEITSQTLGV